MSTHHLLTLKPLIFSSWDLMRLYSAEQALWDERARDLASVAVAVRWREWTDYLVNCDQFHHRLKVSEFPRTCPEFILFHKSKVRCTVCGETGLISRNGKPWTFLVAVAVCVLRSFHCFWIPWVNTNHLSAWAELLTFYFTLNACYNAVQFES